MAIPFSNTTQRIPPGFANLLEGLAREVLRNQPDDIPSFAAKYFESLLIEREKTGYDPTEWGAKLEDRFYNNRAFNELAPPGDGVKKEEKEETIEKPKVEDQEVVDIQGTLSEEQAAVKIQSIFRGYKARKEVKGQEDEEGKEPGATNKEAGKEEVSGEPDKVPQ
ncbi:PREDICTED: sperm surface protein Sp17 [Thamnophis sirtalis]|uniref:Sperm surface protein Sp17 n=1 Tax=Thamnophis sirtalis TaxID=35019 RepID=A0A6I9Y367_9SAUR|nr:PREDICTED: sperm surface protein Sp17 [Thamnophis sirtalis]XP_013917668.1 PREDICTED: sperm surface protein Sp17 [Thamnophis sirtalis]XP_032085244.1 sperm surface protein Sp17 [Thamnophis elegans]XP_032085245.1 sperm surface protein Sp17 [Thamnophis elegans]